MQSFWSWGLRYGVQSEQVSGETEYACEEKLIACDGLHVPMSQVYKRVNARSCMELASAATSEHVALVQHFRSLPSTVALLPHRGCLR